MNDKNQLDPIEKFTVNNKDPYISADAITTIVTLRENGISDARLIANNEQGKMYLSTLHMSDVIEVSYSYTNTWIVIFKGKIYELGPSFTRTGEIIQAVAYDDGYPTKLMRVAEEYGTEGKTNVFQSEDLIAFNTVMGYQPLFVEWEKIGQSPYLHDYEGGEEHNYIQIQALSGNFGKKEAYFTFEPFPFNDNTIVTSLELELIARTTNINPYVVAKIECFLMFRGQWWSLGETSINGPWGLVTIPVYPIPYSDISAEEINKLRLMIKFNWTGFVGYWYVQITQARLHIHCKTGLNVTLRNIITDPDKGIIPEYVEKILGGASSGHTINDDYVYDYPDEYKYIYMPYESAYDCLQELIRIGSAMEATKDFDTHFKEWKGLHFIFSPDGELLLAPVGNHNVYGKAEYYNAIIKVDSFDNAMQQWHTVGISPYLNNDDGDNNKIYSDALTLQFSYYYGFEDINTSDMRGPVTLSIKAKRANYIGGVGVTAYLSWIGGSVGPISFNIDTDVYSIFTSPDLYSSGLNTVAKINSLKLALLSNPSNVGECHITYAYMTLKIPSGGQYLVEDKWKARPLLTPIRIKEDIVTENFKHETHIANYVMVAGKYMLPMNDFWCENAGYAGWLWKTYDPPLIGTGYLTKDFVDSINGDMSVKFNTGGPHAFILYRPIPTLESRSIDFTKIIGYRSPASVNLQIKGTSTGKLIRVRLYTTEPHVVWETGNIWDDDADYFETIVSVPDVDPDKPTWTEINLPVDYNDILDITKNNLWTRGYHGFLGLETPPEERIYSNPQWNNINYIGVWIGYNSVFNIDDVCVAGHTIRAAYDSTKIASNGCRMITIKSSLAQTDSLNPNDDSSPLAQTVLYELLRYREDILSGSHQIPLTPELKAGQIVTLQTQQKADLSYTINREFRLLEVEHKFSKDGAFTTIKVTSDLQNSNPLNVTDPYAIVMRAVNPDFQTKTLASIRTGEDFDAGLHVIAKDYPT